jgi:hypothetical protein
MFRDLDTNTASTPHREMTLPSKNDQKINEYNEEEYKKEYTETAKFESKEMYFSQLLTLANKLRKYKQLIETFVNDLLETFKTLLRQLDQQQEKNKFHTFTLYRFLSQLIDSQQFGETISKNIANSLFDTMLQCRQQDNIYEVDISANEYKNIDNLFEPIIVGLIAYINAYQKIVHRQSTSIIRTVFDKRIMEVFDTKMLFNSNLDHDSHKSEDSHTILKYLEFTKKLEDYKQEWIKELAPSKMSTIQESIEKKPESPRTVTEVNNLEKPSNKHDVTPQSKSTFKETTVVSTELDKLQAVLRKFSAHYSSEESPTGMREFIENPTENNLKKLQITAKNNSSWNPRYFNLGRDQWTKAAYRTIADTQITNSQLARELEAIIENKQTAASSTQTRAECFVMKNH